MLKPWLYLRSWTFTSWKTSTSVWNARSFNPFKQINIFNQPTGYSHIEIRPASDLVELVWDIYYYSLYYNSFQEKMGLLDLYKTTLLNLEKYSYDDLFQNAHNIVKSWKTMQDLLIRIKLFLWKLPKCVLTSYQAKNQVEEIEKNYLVNREQFIKQFWDDLLLNYFFNLSLDELQLYFWVRNFSTNFSWKNAFLVDFICFPVKLNSRIEWIVQNEQMLDVYFRRQASNYLRNEAKLFWLLKKEKEFQPNDTEKVRMDDSNITSQSTTLNFYKLFWIPKLQYYRNHLINSKSKKIYKPWLLFEYIREMTDRYNQTLQPKENKTPKIILA